MKGSRRRSSGEIRSPRFDLAPLNGRDSGWSALLWRGAGLQVAARWGFLLSAATAALRRFRVSDFSRALTSAATLALACLCLPAFPLGGAEPTAEALRAEAYQLYERKRFEEAATVFRLYLERNAEDLRASLDYAGLLSQLNRHADAARLLETVHRRQPQHEPAWFRLGVEYVALGRYDDAEPVFTALSGSANRDLAAAATEALQRLRADRARAARLQAEQRIFALADEHKHREVLDAIGELEKQDALSFKMELQRIYALQGLGDYAAALERADKLTPLYPKATDLMLVRADLLAQLGRRPEAEAIWRSLLANYPGTAAALVASQRLQGFETPEEDRIYELAGKQKYREVVEAINELERKKPPLAWAMEMQRLYAWQALGDTTNVLAKTAELAQAKPQATDLALLRADLLIQRRQWTEAGTVLKGLKDTHPGTPVAEQAQARLEALPEMANVDKWYWGEAYLAGQYLGRFGSVVGSGFARSGFYIQNLRWLQPYGVFKFGADTGSGLKERTTVTDHFVGFFGGVRLQPFATEYLFAYAEFGASKDLLDQRENGDWTEDYQAGLYGFKSWGPGTVLLRAAPAADVRTTGNVPADTTAPPPAGEQSTEGLFWRGAWFVDAGADFSYYHRYRDWIGFGQAKQGFRLLQFGPSFALDGYAVENLSWDTRGNYYDNLVEVGPGARVLWVPAKRWEVVLRGEYVWGFYFGRDDFDTRGDTAGQYEEARVTLSVGLRW